MVAGNPDIQSIKLGLDRSVERQDGESLVHWAMKAATVSWLESDPRFEGTIRTEKKVEDKIADVRCEFSEKPDHVPRYCVFEMQTTNSNKNYTQTTRRYHRFGYSVFWLFSRDAARERREAEEALSQDMSEPPSLGLIALEDGELQIGRAVTPDVFEDSSPKLLWNELYIPTYDRPRQIFDHGDFADSDGERFSLVSIDGQLFVSHEINDKGQRTLPQQPTWHYEELSQAIVDECIERTSPVRGPV